MRRLDVHLGQVHWSALTWDSARLATLLGQVSREQGRLLGRMQDLGFELRREAQLSTLTEDVVRSSEIEGEKLDSAQVRSSIARRLGMEVEGLVARGIPAAKMLPGTGTTELSSRPSGIKPIPPNRNSHAIARLLTPSPANAAAYKFHMGLLKLSE